MKKAKGATTETISKKILNNQKIFGIKLMKYLRIKANSLEDVFLNENGMILTNQVIVSVQFNNYIVTVDQNLVDDIGETANKFQDYVKNSNEHSMFLKEVKPGEI